MCIGMKFAITSGPSGTISNEVFWAGISAYWRRFPGYADEGSYGYSSIFPTGDGGFIWDVSPWVVPEMNLADFKTMSADLVAEWKQILPARQCCYTQRPYCLAVVSQGELGKSWPIK
jgi:hypothetical protein